MNSAVTIFSKDYSELSKLQSQKKVNYGLIEDEVNGKKYYGIGISIEEDGFRESDFLENLSTSKTDILNIVTFLYENSILIDTWKEITSELLGCYCSDP
ncbi:hypothetical protein EDD70_1616 [Hydrogenoanaerobacterium saccharovorans]|uniref:Uncharacterized protein n=1 Tax=Hydrogenoanaerobacterium saccharovorans TaxID=474960 RepID=A0A1H7Z9I7_9FIRM|nr:DUF6514 family protein [Hydrogenoanaerobacterium saccharovorans]RPF48790.1 hypothetical protein EDD70_1616 [Hydrogenoanaerobacterium saccharovorans]SEM54169.1 hypothetical protein SAMN05216180_0480 [Hydrogenoanaerobacterium saccharovorans]